MHLRQFHIEIDADVLHTTLLTTVGLKRVTLEICFTLAPKLRLSNKHNFNRSSICNRYNEFLPNSSLISSFI